MARVTLTFDNGPTPGVTERVLDILAARGVLATFFVVADNLRSPAGRALAERAVAEGHRVGNHTLTHTVPLGELEQRGQLTSVWREIDDAQELLGDLAPERYFRPYGAGGVLDDRLLGPHGLAHLTDGGYQVITWNCVPRDWVDPVGWVDVAMAAIDAQPWSVVVLHDIKVGALDGLEDFLDRCAAAGVEIRTDFPDDVRLVSLPA
jgi:peptidoglycan/xylan/chitin deacetylase (PgdA/CDA1 family)